MKRYLMMIFGVFLLIMTACGGSGNTIKGDATGGPGVRIDVRTLKTKSIKIYNPYEMPVNVFYNGRYLLWLNPYSYSFIQLPVGTHTFIFIDGYRNQVGEQTISNE